MRRRRGGSSVSPVSALQPLIRLPNIIAAYAFNEPAAACNTDRSGHGNNFSGSNLASDMANVMDLVPGKAACIPAGNTLYSTAPKQCRVSTQAWVDLYGPMSLTVRVWGTAPNTVAGARTLFYANANDTTNGSTPLQLYISLTAGVFKLGQYYERLKVGKLFTSANLAVPPNEWIVCSYRRTVAGLVTLGTHRGPGGSVKAYETNDFTVGPLSSVTALMAASFGQTHFATDLSDYVWADTCVWNTDLTDAEIEGQAAVMLAGAP